MSEEQKAINVYESRRFEQALEKLSESQQKQVEDEIERIIDNPQIGEQKRGDLSHIRVHKFRIDNQLTLLAYSWVMEKLELYMLSLGSHEGFYQKLKGARRKADLSLIQKP